MSYKYCTECGAKIPIGANFCSSCGCDTRKGVKSVAASSQPAHNNLKGVALPTQPPLGRARAQVRPVYTEDEDGLDGIDTVPEVQPLTDDEIIIYSSKVSGRDLLRGAQDEPFAGGGARRPYQGKIEDEMRKVSSKKMEDID
jgi:hypothetical protein